MAWIAFHFVRNAKIRYNYDFIILVLKKGIYDSTFVLLKRPK